MKSLQTIRHSTLRRACLLALASLLVIAQPGKASPVDTVNNGSTDLTSPASYTPAALPGTNDDVEFTPATTYNPATFTVGPTSTGLSIGTLNDLSTTALTINNSAGAASTLTLNGDGSTNTVAPNTGDVLYVATGGNLTIANASTGGGTLGVVLNTNGNFDIAGAATVTSIVSGTGGITKTGAGTLTLSGKDTYMGTTTINNGILNIGNVVNVLGSIANSQVVVSGSGSLEVSGGNGGGSESTTWSGPLTGTGGFIDNQNNPNTKFTMNQANTYTGATQITLRGVLAAGANSVTDVNGNYVSGAFGVNSAFQLSKQAAPGTLYLAGFSVELGSIATVGGVASGSGIVLDSATAAGTLITGGDNSNQSFAGVISDGAIAGGAASGIPSTVVAGGKVIKIGTGTQTLTAANTYTGGTTVTAGTLQAGNAAALGNGNVAVSGGTLQGTVAAVNLAANLTLSSGIFQENNAGTGKFTLTGSTSSFAITGGTWDLAINGSGNDQVVSTGGANTSFTISGGTLDLTGDMLTAGTYTILTGFGSGTGNFTSITGYDTSMYLVTFDDSTPGVGVLDVAAASAAPEPSTWAMLLGGLGLLIGRARWQSLRNKSQYNS